MPAPQNFKNHTRFDPSFHFVLAPLLIANILLSLYITHRDWPIHSRSHLWWIVMSFGLMLLANRMRMYSLKVQDRLIRLEERLRYAALLPAPELDHASQLTIKQVVALRFASDAELPALLKRAIAEKLTPKQIKESIQVWRPDYDRV
jgi:hypothetical protein